MEQLPTMVDSAGGDNNGTTQHISQAGGAYKFDGSTSLATAADKSKLDPGTAGVRLTAKISLTKAPAVGQTFDIVRNGVPIEIGVVAE